MTKTSESTSTIGQHIITDAVMHMRKTQLRMNKEQNKLLETIAELPQKEEYADFTFDNLPYLVRSTLESEQDSVRHLNNLIAINKANGCITHYGITTHKLSEIIEGTINISNDDNILNLLSRRFPEGYQNSLDLSLPVLGNEANFWGTSKPTFLTTLLESTRYTITGRAIDSRESSIFHTFNCPENFDGTGLTNSLFIDVQTPSVRIKIPHSGYSFGGDRLNMKEFKPQDCTSFLEMKVQLPANGASTVDFYLAKRVISEHGLVVVGEDWLDSTGGNLIRLLNVNTETPMPGDICVVRKFNESKPINHSLGCGGHAGIYLGRDQANIITLAYNRDMPRIEGFGLEYRIFEESSETADRFYMTRNDLNFIHTHEAFPFRDHNDLPSLTEYVDRKILDEYELELHGESPLHDDSY